APRVADWLTFCLAFAGAGALGLSLGLVVASLAVFWPAIDRLHGPILRSLIWVSGIFFTSIGLPSMASERLLLNPVLHMAQFVRTGWFVEYRTEHASAAYVLFWLVGLLFFGMALERVARRRLEVT